MKEFHSQFKHITCIANKTTDTLSQLDPEEKKPDDNEINWKSKLLEIKYINNTKNIIFYKYMNSMDFKEDSDN